MIAQKIYNFHQLINVTSVKEMDPNQALALTDALIVEGMEEYVQIRDSSQFNKLAHSVLVVVKRLLTHAQIVMGREINKLQKKYQ